MEFFKNRTVATFVSAIIIISSIFIGGNISLNKLRTKAENTFFTGVDNDGFCIQNDLETRISLSYNLVTIAKRYIGEDEVVNKTSNAREALTNSKSVGEKYVTNLRLTEATTELVDKLKKVEMEGKDGMYRDSLYADLTSRNYTINNNPYNQTALNFNELLNKFPGNMLKTFRIIRPLETFSN